METTAMRSEVLAEERHSGRTWSLLILPALLGPAISVALVPTGPARVALAVVGVIGVGTLAMVWSGFQYRFLQHGVEIRTLGFHLRSIPKQAIVSYSIEPWAFARGYGIRGIGSARAYVWGNKVVHIKTTNGEVFLGHDDPERIVRDLDQVTGFATPASRQAAMQSSTNSALPGESMNREWHKPPAWLIWLMWLALAISATNYWSNWDQLPMRMAVHFDANWQPNGYTSREGAVMLGLGIMAVLLVLFTVGAFIVRTLKPAASWPFLVGFYLLIGVLWYGNASIIRWNLNPPAHSELVGPIPPALRDSSGKEAANCVSTTTLLALHS